MKFRGRAAPSSQTFARDASPGSSSAKKAIRQTQPRGIGLRVTRRWIGESSCQQGPMISFTFRLRLKAFESRIKTLRCLDLEHAVSCARCYL